MFGKQSHFFPLVFLLFLLLFLMFENSVKATIINPPILTKPAYVADTSNNRIQKFSGSGIFLTKWGSLGSGNGQFKNPSGIAVDNSGNVFVADTDNNRIQKFQLASPCPTSTTQIVAGVCFVTKWGSSGSGNGQFDKPLGVATDNSGNVFVADYWHKRVEKFSNSGTFLTKWSVQPLGTSLSPSDIAVDKSGNVFVISNLGVGVYKYSNTGTFLTMWGSSGSGNGQFKQPNGIDIDFSGNVFVADTANSRIQKFSNTGTFLTKWGSSGSGNGQFNQPFGVAVDPNFGVVFVDDYSNNRIQKFSNTGTFLTKWGSSGSGNGQLHFPKAIDVG
jgi:tripartite motif-containing protein 71